SLVIGCCVGTFVVAGSLAAYRCISLQGGMDMMEEQMTGDLTDRFDSVSEGATSAQENQNPTLTSTVMEDKLIFISLVGIALLGLMGAIFAFNGPVVLLVFLTLGIMALITGVTTVFGLFIRLLRWIIMIVYAILHMILNALLGISAMVARPFVILFSIHGTDINNDGEDNEDNVPPQQPPRIVETSQQNANQPSSSPQSEEAPPDNPQTVVDQTLPEEDGPSFKPSDAEWNPL
ncbi:MAG: hypothetical protein ACE5PV_20860, partial [Candidatus Poribacteria bacterium]